MGDINGELSPCGLGSLGEAAPHSFFAPRDAWNNLGLMTREEAMAAYISEMKLVAQKVGEASTYQSHHYF